MRILYLVHDVTDPAVLRRVEMLSGGGANVVLAGFRRRDEPVFKLGSVPVLDLGRTHDARLASRAFLVLKTILLRNARCPDPSRFDLIIARNLEMLLIAHRLIWRMGQGAPAVIYECLDIHRLMLGRGVVTAALRRLEQRLLRRSLAVIVSSPAFLRHYFRPVQRLEKQTILIENKALLDTGAAMRARESERRANPRPPFRIGWFGMIRCRRSFDFLSGLAADGRFEIIMAGRPTPAVFPDFEALVDSRRNVHFLGAYRVSDIPTLYRDVDFAWAIDFYEEELNSKWLLPNRLYESAACGAVPIALASTETGARLAELGLGLVAADLDDVRRKLDAMRVDELLRYSSGVLASKLDAFVQTDADNRALVQTLSTLRSPAGAFEMSPK